MKFKAKNRSARLRKKLRVDEFQEFGFDIAWTLPKDTTSEGVENFLEKFFDEIIQPQNLGFGGEGDTIWHGLICTEKLGSCTEEHREVVEKWLNDNGATSVSVGPLYDVWWAE